MPDDALTLLRDALRLLNDRPNFSTRDRSLTSYQLAARIDAYLDSLTGAAPAIPHDRTGRD